MAAFAVIHSSEIKTLLNGAGVAMTRVVLTKQVSLQRPLEETSQSYHLV